MLWCAQVGHRTFSESSQPVYDKSGKTTLRSCQEPVTLLERHFKSDIEVLYEGYHFGGLHRYKFGWMFGFEEEHHGVHIYS